MVALLGAKGKVLVFRILVAFRILIAFRILMQKTRFPLFNHRPPNLEPNPPGSWGWFSKAHLFIYSPNIYSSLDFLDWGANFDISLLPSPLLFLA